MVLVMLLPHGYEGQGPEHSTRQTRKIPSISSQKKNLIVTNITTPANLFICLEDKFEWELQKPFGSILHQNFLLLTFIQSGTSSKRI